MTLFVYNRLYASPHRYIVVFCDNTGQTTAVSWYLASSCSRLLPWRISLTLRASLGLPKMRSTLCMVRGSPSHRLVHDFLDLLSVLRVHISNSISIISAVLAQFTLVTKRQIDKRQTNKHIYHATTVTIGRILCVGSSVQEKDTKWYCLCE